MEVKEMSNPKYLQLEQEITEQRELIDLNRRETLRVSKERDALKTEIAELTGKFTAQLGFSSLVCDQRDALYVEIAELKEMCTVKKQMRFCVENEKLGAQLEKAKEALGYIARADATWKANALARKILAELEKK
jgi:prophage DNA circulation protein